MPEPDTLYCLTDYFAGLDWAHSPTLEDIREFLTYLYSKGKLDPTTTQFAASSFEPLVRFELTRSANKEWLTGPAMPAKPDVTVTPETLDRLFDLVWIAQAAPDGMTLGDMMQNLNVGESFWLIGHRETSGLTITYRGPVDLPEITAPTE
jgi:hypothetical protein